MHRVSSIKQQSPEIKNGDEIFPPLWWGTFWRLWGTRVRVGDKEM